MIKLVAFDWNGTLIADAQLAADGDAYALRPYFKNRVTLQDMRRHFVVPVINYLTALGMDKAFGLKQYKQINEAFNRFYEARVNRCRTRAGARSLLKFLQNNEVAAIIYSNHVLNFIDKQIKRLGIEKYLQNVLARDSEDDRSHMHSRSKGKKLLDYVKKCKLKPEEVISAGDTEEEIEIGKKYGFVTVAITGGYNATFRLKKHKPDFLIHNLKELIPIIKKLNK